MFRNKILKNLLTNQNGYSILFVMGLGGVATLIAISVLRTGQGISGKDINAIRFYSTVELVKSNLYNMLSNDTAWYNTTQDVNNNLRVANFKDMTTGSTPAGPSFGVSSVFATYLPAGPEKKLPAAPATDFKGRVITIRDASSVLVAGTPGAIFYDSTLTTQGFKYDGTVCNTYTKVRVTGGCIMRVRVAFRPFCDVACTVGPASVVLVLNFFTPSKTHATNPGVFFDSRLTDGIVPDFKEDR